MPILPLILAVLAPFAVQASPWLVSDPTGRHDVTHCGIYLNDGERVLSPVALDGVGNPYCRHDLSAVPEGANVIAATFVIQDEAWGEQESPQSDPFSFTRPNSLSEPPALLGIEP